VTVTLRKNWRVGSSRRPRTGGGEPSTVSPKKHGFSATRPIRTTKGESHVDNLQPRTGGQEELTVGKGGGTRWGGRNRGSRRKKAPKHHCTSKAETHNVHGLGLGWSSRGEVGRDLDQRGRNCCPRSCAKNERSGGNAHHTKVKRKHSILVGGGGGVKNPPP